MASDTFTPRSFEEIGNHPIVISPNIGFPAMVCMENHLENFPLRFKFMINMIVDEKWSEAEIENEIKGHLYAIPLYDHDLVTRRLRRGDPIPLEFADFGNCKCLNLEGFPIRELYGLPENRVSYLLWHNFFGKGKKIVYFHVILDISQNEDLSERLKLRKWVMFDLYQTFDGFDPLNCRICYHALVLRSCNWTNFRIAQISDLHVAKRWDELLGLMEKNPQLPDSNDAHLFSHSISILDRFRNPNNMLRKFILWANDEAAGNNLDFIFVTGDIIDYYTKNDIESPGMYSIEESNWDVFLSILLKEPIETRLDVVTRDIIDHEELAVPIFTQTGNHDVRVHGYPLLATGIYRHFNLTQREAKLYKDPFKKNKVKALQIDKYCLRPYYQFINPYDDYFLQLGTQRFLFMNTGGDSFLDIKSLLMGHPGAVGFSTKQFNFARNAAEKIMQEFGPESHNFLITHAPMLNPRFKYFLRYRLLKILGKGRSVPSWIFKERRLKKKRPYDGRADRQLDFAHGVISKHWLETLALMYRYRIINLAGHTHYLREFRFIFCGDESDCSYSLDLPKNPFGIFWDNYSVEYPKEYLEKYSPFVFQTPSLGIGEYGRYKKWGPFREIIFSNDKIDRIGVKFLSDILL